MIPYARALDLVRAAGARRATAAERVPLLDAVGRALAEDVRAREPNPRFDNSGMDGFAVRAADLAAASPARPLTLRVRASLAAGDDAAGAGAGFGGCVEIMTGAPIPAGYDAVVRVEDVEVERDEAGAAVRATFRSLVPQGQDVRPAGDDFRAGALLAEAGAVLQPHHVLALATVGAAEVAVRRRPRVAVITTGKEIRPFSAAALAPGEIRNSNGPYLRAALPLLGAEVVSAEAVGDEPAALRAAIEAARAAGADLVLTTGGASEGRWDYVEDVLTALGADLLFHRVAVRPGKPVLCAELPGGPAVIGLPGNPVASAVSTRFLVAPFLRAALGLAPERPLRAALEADVRKPEGLRCFYKARVTAGPAGVTARATDGQGSAIVLSLLAANGWLVLPEEERWVAAGVEVDVVPLLAPELSPTRGVE